ncbi:MAG TPA: hypothetical protein VJG83_03155 [archaeon]|nr:hypothetical protein [archaeon]
MKIALFSSEKSNIHPLPLIAKELRSAIHNLEVKEHISKNNLDLVGDISQAKGFDAVVVVLFYEKSSLDVKILMEKLVHLDLEGKRTMKFLEKGDDFDLEEESKKISGSILLQLFGASPKAKKGASYKGI